VDFRSIPGTRGAPAGKHIDRLVEAEGGGHQRSRVNVAGRIVLDRSRKPVGRPENADRGHVLESHGPSVDEAGCAGQPDVHDLLPRLHEVERQRRQRLRIRRVDDRVPGQVRKGFLLPHVAESERPREVQAPGNVPHQVHFDAIGSGEFRHQQADGPNAEHQDAIPGSQPGTPNGAQGIATRLHHGARGIVDTVR
jgi:hypothetical protein